jgi:hypothetical protein
VIGDDLDPHEITEQLSVVPTFAVRRGETTQRGTRTITHRSGIWVYKAETALGWELDTAIVQLLAALPADLAVWDSLQSRFKLDLFVGLFMGTDNQGDELKPATLRLLGERGIALGLDVYGPFPPAA